MNSEITDDIVIQVLRDILAKLGDIHGAIDGLTLRIMSLASAGQRHEQQADEVAVDLAYAHLEAAKVDKDAPAGTRADAAAMPSPAERWGESAVEFP